MKLLHLRPYEPDDFMHIALSDYEIAHRRDQNVRGWAEFHMRAGPAGTLQDDKGQIVACMGIHHLWAGTGEAWLTCCRNIKEYGRFLDVAGKALGKFKRDCGYDRIQATVNPDWEAALRLVKHMGFEFEGVMKKYGPNGVDNHLYALTEDFYG